MWWYLFRSNKQRNEVIQEVFRPEAPRRMATLLAPSQCVVCKAPPVSSQSYCKACYGVLHKHIARAAARGRLRLASLASGSSAASSDSADLLGQLKAALLQRTQGPARWKRGGNRCLSMQQHEMEVPTERQAEGQIVKIARQVVSGLGEGRATTTVQIEVQRQAEPQTRTQMQRRGEEQTERLVSSAESTWDCREREPERGRERRGESGNVTNDSETHHGACSAAQLGCGGGRVSGGGSYLLADASRLPFNDQQHDQQQQHELEGRRPVEGDDSRARTEQTLAASGLELDGRGDARWPCGERAYFHATPRRAKCTRCRLAALLDRLPDLACTLAARALKTENANIHDATGSALSGGGARAATATTTALAPAAARGCAAAGVTPKRLTETDTDSPRSVLNAALQPAASGASRPWSRAASPDALRDASLLLFMGAEDDAPGPAPRNSAGEPRRRTENSAITPGSLSLPGPGAGQQDLAHVALFEAGQGVEEYVEALEAVRAMLDIHATPMGSKTAAAERATTQP